MLRNPVIRGCLLCALAGAAACAQAAGGPDTGGTGGATLFQLQQPAGDWRVFGIRVRRDF